MGDGKDEEIEDEGQENTEENTDEIFLEHATVISDDHKFKKNTSEENLKNKNEIKKNNRNITNEKDDKTEPTNNSSVNSQLK